MLKHKVIKYVFGALLLLGSWASVQYRLPLWHVFLIGCIWLVITTWGAFDIRSNYFTRVLYKGSSKQENVVSITFDDGPTMYTTQILQLLEKYNMKATFFCIGHQVQRHPEIIQQILHQGHSIGNHSFTHSEQMGFFSTAKITEEIERTDRIIHSTIGVTPLLYRPPFGVTNPNIAKACNKNGKTLIGWNIRSLDTLLTDRSKIINRIIPRVKSGDIILLHDTSERTVEVLEQLLKQLQKRGYRSVEVNYLLNIKAYT